ncbi:hypothetical protein GCM10018954_058310 [Kutzneria kofuensis]
MPDPSRRRSPLWNHGFGSALGTCDNRGTDVWPKIQETAMSKRARKRRDRKKGGANHGKRPNA